MKAAVMPSASFMAKYRDEVLRWNRQISLITRKNPESRLASLFQQSLDGISALWREVLAPDFEKPPGLGRVYYCDLGSGAGIPGLIWQKTMVKTPEFGLVEARLFEPRGKRAWFMTRVIDLMGLEKVSVEERRWGDGAGPSEALAGEAPRTWIISMKALRLTDAEVLTGLEGSFGKSALGVDNGVYICRYLPPPEKVDNLKPPAERLSTSAKNWELNTVKQLKCGRPDEPTAVLGISVFRGPLE